MYDDDDTIGVMALAPVCCESDDVTTSSVLSILSLAIFRITAVGVNAAVKLDYHHNHADEQC